MRLFLLILLIGSLFACQPETEEKTITVFAASSLTDSFIEMGQAYERVNPGTRILFNFGGSSQLAAQIQEGAPADVFASANLEQMQTLTLDRPPERFATNRLLLIVPPDNPANIAALADVANPGVRFVTAIPGVPIRTYIDRLLARQPAPVRDGIVENIISEEANVRQILLKIALGEADAAIVYTTDIMVPDVDIMPIVLDTDITPSYYMASTGSGEDFIDFVNSSAGRAILQKWGFNAVVTP